MRGYVYQRARFERGLRYSGYLSGEIENRETNGNKSKLLRASLQACFACNCSNLRKHSPFSFFLLFLFTFANLIMMIIIGRDDTMLHISRPICFFVFSSYPTHI